MPRLLLLAFAALLAAMGALPMGHAQSVEDPTLLLTDAAGDVMLHSNVPPSEAPVPRPDADLLGLDVAETPSDLLVYLRLARLPSPDSSTERPQASYSIWFELNGTGFFLWIPFRPSELEYGAELYTADRSEQLADLQLDVVPRLSAFVAHVPRDVLAKKVGAELVQGVTVGGWHAETVLLRTIKQDSWVGDTMNAGLADPVAYALVLGSRQSGPVRLSSPNAYVVSNGLATSYPLRLSLENAESHGTEVRLRSNGAPPGWQVTLPDAAVNVPPMGRADVTFVLTVPFRHQHGGLDRFTVEATDAGGSTLASLDMGVIYTATPQPAGHHDELHIHSGVTGPYFNTLEEDEADSGQPIANQPLAENPVGSKARWTIPLEPALATGLDFDLARNGSIQVALASTAPMTSLSLGGMLRVSGPGGSTDLAAVVPTNTADAQPMRETTLTASLVPKPEADLVPFERGSNLVLDLEVRSAVDQATALAPPDLMPGGTLTLPLFDYHDDIDAALRALSGLSWSAESTTTLRAPPGGLASLPLMLESQDGAAHSISVQVDSSPAGIAEFVGERRAVVKAGAPLQGVLVVRVPSDAFDGQLLDAVVVAQDQSGSGALAIQRVAILVDRSAPSGAEPGETAGQDAPASGVGTACLALLACIAARRRRRRH